MAPGQASRSTQVTFNRPGLTHLPATRTATEALPEMMVPPNSIKHIPSGKHRAKSCRTDAGNLITGTHDAFASRRSIFARGHASYMYVRKYGRSIPGDSGEFNGADPYTVQTHGKPSAALLYDVRQGPGG